MKPIIAALGIATAGAATAVGWFYLQTPVVQTSLATLAPVSEAVYGTGTVEPVRWAKVVPVQRKRIVELCRCEGQSVTSGQILGRQDNSEERALLRQLEIRHEQLDRELDRAAKDRNKDRYLKADHERLESLLKEAGSRIIAQKGRLDTLVFRAPVDGMVLRRDGEVGEIVGPADVLFWVGSPTPMQVVAEINEEEINKIAPGQKVFLRSDAFAQALTATVSQVTPKGDAARKTFRIYAMLPDNTPLRIGMSVEANIVYRERRAAVVIPVEAVTDGNTVQVVSDGKVQRVAVTPGIRGSRFMEIAANLPQGARVLAPARSDLADGTAVEVEDVPVRLANNPPAESGSTYSLASAQTAPRIVHLASKDDIAIGAAMSAHMHTIVIEARRHLSKYRTTTR